MHRALLSRYLTTFMEAGYVEQGRETGRCCLAPSSYRIDQKSLSCKKLVQTTRPILERLALECNEAADLANAHSQELLLLDMVDTTQKVAVVPLAGKRVPLSGPVYREVVDASGAYEKVCGGMGDLLPSPQAEFLMKRAVIVEFANFGDDSIADTAVPFFDSGGFSARFLCLIGPNYRLSAERIEHELGPRLQEVAHVVSAKMGDRDH